MVLLGGGGVGCVVTVVGRVVVVVASGWLEQDINIKPSMESAEIRIIDFFIV